MIHFMLRGVPVVLPIPSSGAAASVLESARTSDRLSGHPSCPYCVVCPAPLFGLIHYPLSLLFLVNVLSINHICPLICICVPFLADPWQLLAKYAKNTYTFMKCFKWKNSIIKWVFNTSSAAMPNRTTGRRQRALNRLPLIYSSIQYR